MAGLHRRLLTVGLLFAFMGIDAECDVTSDRAELLSAVFVRRAGLLFTMKVWPRAENSTM
jgi:hypothetical protein